MAGGRVEFRGTVTDDGTYDGEVDRARRRRGGAGRGRRDRRPWRGRLSGRAVGHGQPRAPAARRRASKAGSSRWAGAERWARWPRISTRAGDGRWRWTRPRPPARLALAVAGRVGAGAALRRGSPRIAAQVGARPVRARPRSVVRALGIPRRRGLGARSAGPSRARARWPPTLEITDVELRLPDYPVSNRGPLVLAVRDGRRGRDAVPPRRRGHRPPRRRLRGPGRADAPLDVTVAGAADLRALSLVSRELRGHGGARLALGVRHAGGAAGRRHAGPRRRRHPAARLPARAGGRAGHASPSTPAARSGPGSPAPSAAGRVELSGQAAHAGGRLVSFDVQAAGRGHVAPLPGGAAEQRRRRAAAVRRPRAAVAHRRPSTSRQAVWTRRYDVASELLAAGVARRSRRRPAGRRPALRREGPGAGHAAHRQQPRHAAGARRPRPCRAPTTRRCSSGAPRSTAAASTSRATPTSSAAAPSTSPTRRRSTRSSTSRPRRGCAPTTSSLKVQGTLDRVTPTLTSDPPLSTVAILSLLAGADESEVERTSELPRPQRPGRDRRRHPRRRAPLRAVRPRAAGQPPGPQPVLHRPHRRRPRRIP